MSDSNQLRALDQVGTIARGKSKHRPRNDPSLYGGEYPFIQTGDVKHSNFYITEYSQTYNEKGLAQSKLWNPGTLCITIAANIAETAILQIPACFPDSIIGFIPDKDKSDVRFIKYCLDTYKLQMQAISQGTTQDNLSMTKLLSIHFKIPLLDEQKKIAAVLSAYDDLIENNNKRIALLEKAAEEIYREWFVRLRFPGWETAVFHKGIPDGWILGNVGMLYKVKSGFAFKSGDLKGDGFPVIKIRNITESGVDIDSCQRYSGELTKRVLQFELVDGDLLIAMTGAQIGKNSIFIGNEERFFLNQRVGKFFPNDKTSTNNAFMFFTAQSENFGMV